VGFGRIIIVILGFGFWKEDVGFGYMPIGWWWSCFGLVSFEDDVMMVLVGRWCAVGFRV
jgi:hypothetical protein